MIKFRVGYPFLSGSKTGAHRSGEKRERCDFRNHVTCLSVARGLAVVNGNHLPLVTRPQEHGGSMADRNL